MPPLSPAQRHQLLVEWNDTLPQGLFKVGLHHMVRTRALRHGSSLAVDDGVQSLTLEDVVRRASGLAGDLKRLGVGREDLVALYLEPGAAIAWAILGILESRAACLPLDPSAPINYHAAVLRDANPRVLLTAGFPPKEISNGSWDIFDVRKVQPAAFPPPLRDPEFSLKHLAYVFYPQDEAETPVGVEASHRTLTHLARRSQRNLGIRQGSYVGQTAALSTESCAGEIWASMTHAAHLKIAPASARASREAMRSWSLKGDVPILCTHLKSKEHSLSLRASPDARLYVLDRELQPVPLGSEGEIFLAGGSLPRGFRGRPALTSCNFFPNPFHKARQPRDNEEFKLEAADRLYRTGWHGRFCPDGTVQFQGSREGALKKSSLFSHLSEGNYRLFSPQ